MSKKSPAATYGAREEAQNPATYDRELEEDLADRMPRILYVPRDVVMLPVIAARGIWVFLGYDPAAILKRPH